MKLKIQKLEAGAVVPAYAHPGDAGMDLYALESHRVKARQQVLVRTGIAMQLPKGHVGLIWDKSGFATKQGFKVMGGVIDEGYRGEVKVGLINLSSRSYTIEAGERIAQLLVQPVTRARPELVRRLGATRRGRGGFGSTGKK